MVLTNYEKIKRWREAHPEAAKARRKIDQKRYYAAHTDFCKKLTLKYQMNNYWFKKGCNELATIDYEYTPYCFECNYRRKNGNENEICYSCYKKT